VKSISVITAAIPARVDMLAEACRSVRAQTLPCMEHLIGFDYDRRGSAATRNSLLRAASGEWVAILDDDDLMKPYHLAMLEASSNGADIVYSWCEVEGRAWDPNSMFDAERLLRENYIPITTLIRRELLADLGGFREDVAWEDHDLWLRALEAGAEFRCVPAVTWIYRFHAGNKTMVGEKAAA
jgi:glycosyltransferase involved in cell wall biosynthesis